MSQQINLFNPVFLKQKKYFSLVAMLQAEVLILAGAALFYAYAYYQVQWLAEQSREVSQRYTTEQGRFVRFTQEFSPEQANLKLTEEVKALEAQLAAQNEMVEKLKNGVVGNTSGYSEYLRAFARQSIEGLWLTGFDIQGDGAGIRLQGMAQRGELLPAYIRRLKREPVMRGKTFATLRMAQPDSARTEAGKSGLVAFELQSVALGEKQ